jgi:MFS family permease
MEPGNDNAYRAGQRAHRAQNFVETVRIWTPLAVGGDSRATVVAAMANLLALLFGFGLMQMGNTLQGTLLSVRGADEAFSPAAVGAVGAAFWIGIVLGSLLGGRLIRRVGHIRTFAALGAIAATAPLIHLLAINPTVWVLARALTGFCFAGMFMVVESWLNGVATPQTRGRILSVYGMTGLVAGIGGQLLLATIDPDGYKGFCVVGILIAFALVPIALTRAAPPGGVGAGARITLTALYRQCPFGAVIAPLCGVTTGAFFALGPVVARQRGLDTGGIAFFMACATLGGFLLAWPLGGLSDRIDRRIVVVGAAFAAAASLVAMIAFVPNDASRTTNYLCIALFGGTVVPTYSIVMAHVNDTVGKSGFVAASGCLLLVNGVGAAVGPIIGGIAMSTWPHGLGYTLVTTQFTIAVWGLHRIMRKAPREHKGPFLLEPPVPVATTLAPAYLGTK